MESLIWKKSTRSGPNGGQCVEVAVTASNIIRVRDSKTEVGPQLQFSPSAWKEFIALATD
jgi:hypothetical protein